MKILAIAILFVAVIAIIVKKAIIRNKKKSKPIHTTTYYHVKQEPVRPQPVAEPSRSTSEKIDVSRLKDSRDRQYALNQEDATIIRQARTSVSLANKTNLSKREGIDLSLDFFDQVEELVRTAEIISKNTEVSTVYDSTFHYYCQLWYRSVLASNMLESAEQIVGNKVMYFHKIKFDSITAEQRKTIIQLQRDLPKYQSMLAKKKIELWNNNRALKQAIRASGERGRQWYDNLNSRIEQKKNSRR